MIQKILLKTILFLLLTNISVAQIGFSEKLSNATIELTHQSVKYDPTYFKINYPNGDVPSNKGVCTDVVIRAYRKLGIDLQKEVHEDMVANFTKYPNLEKWGLKTTDKNIDHRRVPNLEVFFGTSRGLSSQSTDYTAKRPVQLVICV